MISKDHAGTVGSSRQSGKQGCRQASGGRQLDGGKQECRQRDGEGHIRRSVGGRASAAKNTVGRADEANNENFHNPELEHVTVSKSETSKNFATLRLFVFGDEAFEGLT